MPTTTYVTASDALLAYPNASEFTSDQRTKALADSFGLVNSYLNSALQVPPVGEWDGVSAINSPIILKKAQEIFYRWCLEFSNIGQTPELQEMYDSAVKICQGITNNELSVPQAQTFPSEAGYNITSVTQAEVDGVDYAGLGWVYARGTVYENVFLRIVTSGTGYVNAGSVKITIYRSGKEAAVVTESVAYDTEFHSYELGDSFGTIELRFDGRWGAGSVIQIAGVPNASVDSINPADFINTVQILRRG